MLSQSISIFQRIFGIVPPNGAAARLDEKGTTLLHKRGREATSWGPSTRLAPEPKFGKPAALFADEYDVGQSISIRNYDVTRDGRFIMLRRDSLGSKLRVVIHWAEELKQILAAGGVR